jgi:hypothetical protein
MVTVTHYQAIVVIMTYWYDSDRKNSPILLYMIKRRIFYTQLIRKQAGSRLNFSMRRVSSFLRFLFQINYSQLNFNFLYFARPMRLFFFFFLKHIKRPTSFLFIIFLSSFMYTNKKINK